MKSTKNILKASVVLAITLFVSTQVFAMDQMIADVKSKPGFPNYSLREFTTAVALINIKYPNATRSEIATKFNAPMAKKYLELNDNFVRAAEIRASDKRLLEMQKLIGQDADVNYTWSSGMLNHSILGVAYTRALDDQGHPDATAAIELLLKNKANPNPKNLSTTLLDFAQSAASRRGGKDFGLSALLRQYGAR